MNTTREYPRACTRIGQSWARRGRLLRTTLIGVACGVVMSMFGPARADSASCDPSYNHAATYPSLVDLPGPDISGEAGIIIYLTRERAIVERDGCLYDVGDRPLEIAFGGLAAVTLLFELPDHPGGASIYVSEAEVWTEMLEPRGDSFAYVLNSEPSLGFEIASPDQPAPTVPVVVAKPIDDDPEPT